MDVLKIVNAGVALVGIPVVIGVLLRIGMKLQVLDDLKKASEKMNRVVGNMTLAITEVQTILKSKFPGLEITQSLLEKPGSPLAPTEQGASILKESGLEKVLDDNKEALQIRLRASLPDPYTDYDVQENARKLLNSLKDDPMMIAVKDWVYANPMRLDILLNLGGLWLRDDFLGHERKINK